jgi:hypothetical protein
MFESSVSTWITHGDTSNGPVLKGNNVDVHLWKSYDGDIYNRVQDQPVLSKMGEVNCVVDNADLPLGNDHIYKCIGMTIHAKYLCHLKDPITMWHGIYLTRPEF